MTEYLRGVQVTLTGIQLDFCRRPLFNRRVDPKLPAGNLYCAADPVVFLPSFRNCDQQVGAELAGVVRLSRVPYDLAYACAVDDGDKGFR